MSLFQEQFSDDAAVVFRWCTDDFALSLDKEIEFRNKYFTRHYKSDQETCRCLEMKNREPYHRRTCWLIKHGMCGRCILTKNLFIVFRFFCFCVHIVAFAWVFVEAELKLLKPRFHFSVGFIEFGSFGLRWYLWSRKHTTHLESWPPAWLPGWGWVYCHMTGIWRHMTSYDGILIHMAVHDKKKGTKLTSKLHFKSPTAERRHVLCVGVGGDRTHAGPPQWSRVCPP